MAFKARASYEDAGCSVGAFCPLLNWCTALSKGACNRGIKTRPSLLLEAGLPAQARRHFFHTVNLSRCWRPSRCLPMLRLRSHGCMQCRFRGP